MRGSEVVSNFMGKRQLRDSCRYTITVVYQCHNSSIQRSVNPASGAFVIPLMNLANTARSVYIETYLNDGNSNILCCGLATQANPKVPPTKSRKVRA